MNQLHLLPCQYNVVQLNFITKIVGNGSWHWWQVPQMQMPNSPITQLTAWAESACMGTIEIHWHLMRQTIARLLRAQIHMAKCGWKRGDCLPFDIGQTANAHRTEQQKERLFYKLMCLLPWIFAFRTGADCLPCLPIAPKDTVICKIPEATNDILLAVCNVLYMPIEGECRLAHGFGLDGKDMMLLMSSSTAIIMPDSFSNEAR